MDEQWSVVGSKKNQRWLWYAWEPRFKRILAHAFGRRTDATLKKRLKLLKPYRFEFFCTDDWQSYSKHLPEEQHIIGKHFTQRIEFQNLNFRTRLKRLARRSICFSRSEEVHDKVIGEFIYREHYQLFWTFTEYCRLRSLYRRQLRFYLWWTKNKRRCWEVNQKAMAKWKPFTGSGDGQESSIYIPEPALRLTSEVVFS